MKKFILILIICFVFSPLYLFADEAEDEVNEDDIENVSKPFRIKDRTVEIGLANVGIGFGNNFLTTSQVFKDKVLIDLNELKNGFQFNFDIGAKPLYFSYNKNNLWGFGLGFGVDMFGALDLSGNMLTLNEVSNDKSDIVGAAFFDIKASGFFHIQKFKIKTNLSVYYPLMYIDPDVSYSLSSSQNGASDIDLKYKVRIYSPISTEDGAFNLASSTPGADIHLGVEYPLAEVLGLKERFNFLDFIVGLDLINIPVVPSSMKEYMEMSGKIDSNGPAKLGDFDDYIDNEDTIYGVDKKDIFRPFKMLVWADWKPFEIVPVSFIPIIGFSVNPMYNEPGSLEAGIKSRFDLANLFIATLGIGYYDRLWKNSIDLALNFRYFEFNIGVDLRSQDFVKSFSGGGIGVNIGFKFGG